MAVIACMSQSRRGSKTTEAEKVMVEEIEVKEVHHYDHHDHRDCHLTHDDTEPDCECALEELEEMDAWTKTMVAIRVMTAFKRRRKKRLEEEKEKAKKERRKTLWRRLGFKLRVFNMFATKISSEDPAKERLIKLKRKLGRHQLFHLLVMWPSPCVLGDITLESEEEACHYQGKIEESLQYQLGYQLQVGDTILTHFTSMEYGQEGAKGKRRKSKVFER